MLALHLVFYYLEGSALYIQNKIWGKYYNVSTGRKFVGTSTACIVVLWLYLGVGIYKLNVVLLGAIASVPLFLWLTYNFSRSSNKTAELKIKEFQQLNGLLKSIYLVYTSILMIVAPIAIIVAVMLRWGDII
ncbi:MAG: hypothetical protein V4687_07980 [Bacteroidota bacterium]